MADFVLALDQGTTSSRSIVFDGTYKIRGLAQREFPQQFPKSGWVEHNPEDLWLTVLETMRVALADAGLSASDIAAIGITNQRETAVVWDRRSGRAIHNAIVWQDRRTADFCAPKGRRMRGTDHRAHWPTSRSILLGHQDRVDPGARGRGAGPRRERRSCLRDCGYLAALASDR